MMTLQHTFGILLLVYSVAVAPLPERRRGRVNYYDEDFGYSSDVPGNSGENVPVKFGRTIYHSAWSTEDTESSDENNDESTRARDMGSKSWSLSNALRLALNFVNKLKIAGSDNPAIEKKNENAPKSNILNEGGDAYWPLFKKWLRRNKILKDGDSLPGNILRHNPRFNNYNHRNYKKKPRRKHFKNAKPSGDENQGFYEKGNRQRNLKPHENNKNTQSQIPEIKNHRISADIDHGSKELSELDKTEECQTSKDENCYSSKMLDKNKDEKSNNLIKTNKQNERIEGIESVLKHPNHTRAKITTESSKKRNNSHDASKYHHNISQIWKISPETQAISSHLPMSQKQQDVISFPRAQNKTNLKAITSTNYKTLSGDSVLNQAPVHIQNEQVVKSKKGPNTSQSQNDLNSTINKQIVINSFTERPTEKSSKDNQTGNLKSTDTAREISNLAQYATNLSVVSSSGSTKSNKPLKVNSKDSQITEKTLQPEIIISNFSQHATNEMLKKVTSNDLPKVRHISKVKDSESVAQHETLPVKYSSSNPQNINTPVRNSNNSQLTKKVLKPTIVVNSSLPQTTDEVIPKVSNDLPVAKTASKVKVPLTNSSLQLPEKNIREKTSNILLVRNGIIIKPLIENIPNKYIKNPKINEWATNSVFASLQSNDEHILEKSSEPNLILTRHEETPLKKIVHQEDIKTESMSEENDFETNNVSIEDEYSNIMTDESYYTDKFTFISPASTKQNNADFDVGNSHFEEQESDSSSEMDSDEVEFQNNEDKKVVNPSNRGDVEKSALPNTVSSKYLKELKEKPQLTNKKSYISSSVEKLSDNEAEDQTMENGEPKEKFDTFLEYLYNHSNNSFFQSLRKESQNL